MLLNRSIKPCCGYCRYGTALGNDEVICIRRGVMESSASCGAFRYEPTKRDPEALPTLKASNLSEDDLSI